MCPSNENGLIFVYICKEMQRIAAIFFAIIMVISSGLVQFVVHVCPEDGASLSAAACESHEINKLGCCDENISSTNDEQCCTDGYFFGLSAKFGGIDFVQIQKQYFVNIIQSESYPDCSQSEYYSRSSSGSNHSPPIHYGRFILDSICCLII